MRISALERLLVTERLPRRATMYGDFAQAMLHERTVEPDEGPFVVSTTRGSFTQCRRRPDGTIWAGFSDVPLGTEAPLVQGLHTALWRISTENAWKNRCRALEEAIPLMRGVGAEPRGLVVPISFLKEAVGKDLSTLDAEKLMLGQGYITKMDNMYVLAGNLRKGQALLTAEPKSVGTYTRTDRALAIMVFRADRSIVLVDTEAS